MSPTESKAFDTATVGLQVQQFLDEWHFRVLHSSVANEMDRTQALDLALALLELHTGLALPLDEREEMMEMEESVMVERLVAQMSPECRETFEHFALQLQLIVSSTTRVRRALEDDDPDAVEASMEASDTTGITQQILKMAVVQAGIEVSEYRGRAESWGKNTEQRVTRLNRSADDAQRAQNQLAAIQSQLSSFGGSQNAKSKKVLMGVASGQDKALCATIFGSWLGWLTKVKSEKDIRDKFEAEIQFAEDKLFEYRQTQLNNVRGVLLRNAADGDKALQGMVLSSWLTYAMSNGKEADHAEQMKQIEAKLAGYKTSQTENTKKVMTRMSAGNDMALMNLCWQAWLKFLEEYKKDKDMEDRVKLAEQQVQAFLKAKSEEAKGVLARMSGASDSGLLHNVVSAWRQAIADEKEARAMEEMVNNGEAKFKSLNQRRGAAAKGVMGRVSHMQEATFMIRFFEAWKCDTKVEALQKEYNSRINHKKQQLHDVQHMFRSFANQLESSLSPREKAKKQSTKQFKESLIPGGGSSETGQ